MKKLILTLTLTSFAFAGPITVYENPDCGCCKEWVKYMQNKGYEVNAIKTQRFMDVKNEYKIKPEYQSCHTAVMDGKVIEGHVPQSAINWLQAHINDTNIIGVSAPGMPAGSPGMEQGLEESYPVIVLLKGGGYKLLSFYKGDVKQN